MEGKRSLYSSNIMNHTITVDFTESCQVEGYGHLLASSYRNFNGFEQSFLTPENLRIKKQAEEWIKKVEEILPSLSGIDIQRYLEWYDFVHRIAFGREADFKFIHLYMKKAMTDMARGEKVDNIGFINWIRSNLYFHIKEIDHNLLFWCDSTIERWIKKFSNFGVVLDQNLNNLRKINILLEENLDRKVKDPGSFKRSLIHQTLPYLQDVVYQNDIAGKYSRFQLEAISNFAFQAGLENSDIDYEKIRTLVLEKLSTLETLDPYSREAYRLDFTYEFRNENTPVLP